MRSSIAAAAAAPVLLLLLVSCLLQLHGADARAFRIIDHAFTSVFSFGGDDFADTVNSLRLSSPARFIKSSLPYGETTTLSGRASDGRIILDFTANDAYDLPLVPPYPGKSRSFSKGANFAVAGATALDVENSASTSFLVHHKPTPLSSFGIQIGWFEQLKPSLCATPEECDDYLSKSLFVAGFGWNDYFFLLRAANKTMDETRTYAHTVVKAIVDGVEKLIKLGGKRVVVTGILPMGCAPMILSLYASPGESSESDYDKYGCLVKFNDLAKYHNQILADEVTALRKKQQEYSVSISFGGVWIPGLKVSPGFWMPNRRVKREFIATNQS